MSAVNILTISGRAIDPWEMTEDDVDIMDIAHSLSLQCRYAGHVPSFYSVAEHCVRAVELRAQAARLITDDLRGDITSRSILLHDAEEAYFQDLVSPTKRRPELQAYVAASARAQAVIASKYSCLPLVDGEHQKEVQRYDREAYEWERSNIRCGSLVGLPPEEAKASFLGMWYLVRPSTFG
jgi:5'-deoxynucleotidase YfbR-like HD superfamily hydrolase